MHTSRTTTAGAALLAVLAAALTLAATGTARSLQAPTISSFSPTRGLVGQKVTIHGSGLGGLRMVQFDGVTATVASANAAGTMVTATVPPETTTGPGTITITTAGGSVSSHAAFTVLPPGGSSAATGGHVSKPSIRVVAPLAAKPGSRIVITGTNLRGALSVRFGGVKAVYTVPSPTRIVATVPKRAHSGLLQIATSLGSASVRFTVS